MQETYEKRMDLLAAEAIGKEKFGEVANLPKVEELVNQKKMVSFQYKITTVKL